MTATNQEQLAVDFLKKEIAQNQAQARRWLVGGVILLVAVGSYLLWIHFSIARIVEPKSLASIVRSQVTIALPDLQANAQQSLIGAAPDAVKNGCDKVVATVPEVRKELEKQILKFIDSEMEAIRQRIRTEFDKTIVEQKDQLRAGFQRMKDPKQAEAIASDLTRKLVTHFKSVLTEMTGRTSKNLVTESRTVLEKIRSDLKRIESGKSLSEEDKRLREFIQLLYIQAVRNAQSAK